VIRTYLRSVVAAACIFSTPALATIVYDDTTTDTGDTLAYVANGFTQIGDQVHLAGTDRLATSATVQFFNFGAAGTFDARPQNRAQLTGILTNLILPGTVMVADIDKAIDNGKGKTPLATMGGGVLTATKDGGKTVLTDSAGHKATITQGDETYTNGVVHHIDALLMPSKPASGPAVGKKVHR